MAFLASPSRAMYTPDNIDDIIYRVSAELDRVAGGVSGIYARDGLWDDDDDDESVGANASTTGRSSRGASDKDRGGVRSKASTSAGQSRSRSATVSLVKDGWRRANGPGASTTNLGLGVMDVQVESGRDGQLRKKASKGLLKGKGRRGELSVSIEPLYGEYDAPALPPTPVSFASPALTTSSTLMSPNSFATHFDTPAMSNDFLPAPPPVPMTMPAGTQKKSSWKRGMEKLFKSKSSTTLRETFKAGGGCENAPPVPSKPPTSTLGAPFPPLPLGESRYPNFHDPAQSPSLPADPFASTLDLASHPPAPRAKMPKSSPSLRDLKAALHLPTHRPKLSKAKSLANLRAPEPAPPASAPPRIAHFSRPQIARTRTADVEVPTLQAPPPMPTTPLPPASRPGMQRTVTDSPPLQPPRPFFHGRPVAATPDRSLSFSASTTPAPSLTSSSSRSVPSLTISTDVPASPASPPSPFSLPLASPTAAPTSPLPPLPASTSAPPTAMIPQAPTMARSASGAVVLPRSRSTSLSLKGPPTSSSFFDLYEQLGIWPGVGDGNKEAQSKTEPKDILESIGMAIETRDDNDVSPAPLEHVEAVPEAADVDVEVMSDPVLPSDGVEKQDGLPKSPSATFSLASWEAAISAFPLVGNPDTNLPYEGDSILSSLSNIAVASSSEHTTVGAASDSQSQGTTQQTTNMATDAGEQFTGAYHSGSRRGSGGSGAPGSAGSSRAPSPNRAGSLSRDETMYGAASESESEASDANATDEAADDVPLSQLHPQAAAAQRILHADAARRRDLRRAERDAVRGRGQSRATMPRRTARNPGEGAWDGEGGVPADILTRKLERVALTRAAGMDAEVGRPAAFARTPRRAGTLPLQVGSKDTEAGPSRLARHPTAVQERGGDRHAHVTQALSRAKSVHHPQSSGMGVERSTSSCRAEPLPAPPPSAPASRSARSRTQSSASHTHRPPPVDASPPVPPGPAAAMRARPVLARCRIEGSREVQLEIYADTVARDVLHMARSRGDLAEPGPCASSSSSSLSGWAVVEVFAEGGLERLVREYEPLQPVVRGWDAGANNCFVLRQTNRAPATWARSLSATPPFIGAYVQCETRRGKWSKRWLETRGGQIFLAKNDKGKDEVHVNTQFVDVYSHTTPCAAPKPYTFALKRHEPAAAFEAAGEHVTTIAADDQVGFKLFAACFDARSYALAQTQPHLVAPRRPQTTAAAAAAAAAAGPTSPRLGQAQPARSQHVNSHGQIRPQPQHGHGHGQAHAHTAPAQQPLVDIKRDKGAFTGRGLLKI
ncbi:hypothetical protein Q5752_000269 [Cryptotrichosporon argae]